MNGSLAERFEAVIGLEVHIQLMTESKIFCSCSTAFGAPPNTHVCPVCLGHPGVLPVLNRRAVELALRFGIAVGAEVRNRNVFARKNYFYPDLPKGYQISQYTEPILLGGKVPFLLDGRETGVRLIRAHLEEDAGKSFHPESGREAATWVDLNRSGVALLEVVSEPDLRSAEEAHAYLERVRQLVVYLDICDGNMEEGSLRCDANVSVRPRGQETLNPKTEIKNLNSFRNVSRALEWEIKRQSRALEAGEMLEQATRLWDAGEGRTRIMRTKEDAHDYRYFPEPDLLPLEVDAAWVKAVSGDMPELPWEREQRLAREYGLPENEAVLLASTRELAAFYETAAAEAGDGKTAANWVMNDVLHLVKEDARGWDGIRIAPGHLGRMIRMVRDGSISGKIGKAVFEEMAVSGKDPETIVKEKGWTQIQDEGVLDRMVEELLAEHPGPLADYVGGKDAAFTFFVGQLMRKTGGRANPGAARNALRAALDGCRNASEKKGEGNG